MSTFRFDKRNLPDDLKTADQQYAFEQYVLDLLKGTASGIDEEDPLFAAVVGMLVLDGFTDVTAAGFAGGFWQIRGEAAGSTYESEGTAKPNSEVYKKAAQAISKARGGDKIVFYQELAFVSRRLIENTPTIPFDSPAFLSQVNVFDDEYVTEGPQGDTIDLPDLSGASGSATPDDLRPDNIRAVGTIMAAYNLEQLRLFDAVDRIVETWWNGQLPVGSDRGSKALDDFFWSSELRLTPAARHMQYGRVLGAAGGEVSTEVQPNTQFDGLWMRLIASLAEYDRQQRIADIVGGQRTNALTLTAEQVRQAGRNSAANASLYGWGGTQFAARRLTKHIRSAFDILNTPEIQSAYGVDGPYKVIERVAPEIGGTPNIVKYRTLADAGKHVFDIVAKYVGVWSGGTGKPLFPDPDDGGVIYTIAQGFGALSHALASQHNGGGESVIGAGAAVAPTPLPGSSDISLEDQNELMRQAGNVIAVMGIQDEQVDQYSQPAETQYAPSVPSLAPLSGAPSSNGNAGLDQLRQMVSQGQVPTADQLKALILPATS